MGFRNYPACSMIRSDQIRGVQDKAAEPMKSRFLHKRAWDPTVLRQNLGFDLMAGYCSEEEANRYSDMLADSRQVKAETSEKWLRPLVSTINEKCMRKDEKRYREGRGWEWCVEKIVMWNSRSNDNEKNKRNDTTVALFGRFPEQ